MSVGSCAEIKSASSVASLNLAEFGGGSRKAMLGVCPAPSLHTSLRTPFDQHTFFHVKITS